MFADCKPIGVSHQEAEILAVRVLEFLAEQRWRMESFIRMTGVTVGDIRDHVSDPDYLGAELEYLLADERCLLAFTERVRVAPELPFSAGRKPQGAIPA